MLPVLLAAAFASINSQHSASGRPVHATQTEATETFKKSSPAVVTISTPTGFGSGVVVDSNGVIITNLHVVQGATKASVRLAKGDVYDDVTVVDFDSRKDLVLLKVKGFNLPTAELGDSDNLSVGDTVFAIGAPQGLELTLSQGIVSALRDSGEGYRVVQTTAAISPGSSGGGLFDDQGRLVGITSFRIKGGENLNFAVPVNYIRGMLSTTTTLTLQELASKTDRSTSESSLSRSGTTAGSGVPQLAKAYVSGNGKIAVIEQDGPRVSVTYSNPTGAIYGHSQLVWDENRKAFIGAGTVNTVCGEFDTRIWAAPRQQEMYVVNSNVIRHRAEYLERVNCSQQRVIRSSWQESLWYVPTK
jgi:S1-C subfamily serine protease